ncbi:MAG: cysteine desulfurase [Firmicutes bacterium]|nr:cysteine desulfurase [Bacillota bacterium]
MYREVYLDNSATTRPFDEVIEYMSFINKNIYGNPSSLHTKGLEAEKLLKKARETIASSLNVRSREVYFTSGGTESNNLAIMGYLKANPRKGKHLITTKIEHPSVLEVFNYLEEEGYSVDYIDVDEEGIILLDMLRDKIRDNTSLISIMYVNNETGSIQPIEEIARLRNRGNKDTILHVDAVQAYGKFRIGPEKLGIDLMSISSHKIHGPKGVGALYVGEHVRMQPIILGGGQEFLMRSGTENVPGICGFGLAAEMIHAKLDENLEKVKGLRRTFIEMLKENIEGFSIISPDNSSPYIVNVSFDNLKAEVLLHHLEEKGIFVSTGSACSSHKSRYSHVLQAMGIKPCNIEGAIRFSFSAENDNKDIIDAIEALSEIIPKIRLKSFRK